MKRLDRPRQALALGLAALAGAVDAVGFLSADGYFVSFMSGNTTRLAVNLAAHPASALIPALLILGFVGGVSAGSAIAITAEKAGKQRKAWVLALVTALLLVSAIARSNGLHGVMLGALVIAMGALNATFQRDGEVVVGLTYMTGALVRLGQALGARLAREPAPQWAANLALWAALAIGALGGAFSFLRIEAAMPWLLTGWAAIMTLGAARLAPVNR